MQVFGRRNAETIDARWRPASEKRQGRKSRSVVHRRCGGLYGDLAGRLWLEEGWTEWSEPMASPKAGVRARGERADGALCDEIGD